MPHPRTGYSPTRGETRPVETEMIARTIRSSVNDRQAAKSVDL